MTVWRPESLVSPWFYGLSCCSGPLRWWSCWYVRCSSWALQTISPCRLQTRWSSLHSLLVHPDVLLGLYRRFHLAASILGGLHSIQMFFFFLGSTDSLTWPPPNLAVFIPSSANPSMIHPSVLGWTWSPILPHLLTGPKMRLRIFHLNTSNFLLFLGSHSHRLQLAVYIIYNCRKK